MVAIFRSFHSVTAAAMTQIVEEELLLMVREVSEDFLYDTIEFNEFLQMMSKQQGSSLWLRR